MTLKTNTAVLEKVLIDKKCFPLDSGEHVLELYFVQGGERKCLALSGSLSLSLMRESGLFYFDRKYTGQDGALKADDLEGRTLYASDMIKALTWDECEVMLRHCEDYSDHITKMPFALSCFITGVEGNRNFVISYEIGKSVFVPELRAFEILSHRLEVHEARFTLDGQEFPMIELYYRIQTNKELIQLILDNYQN